MWSLVLFGFFLIGCLQIIPFGLPGLWVMLLGALLFNYFQDPAPISLWALLGGGVIAGTAELIEFLLAGRFARQYGGSKRAEWGAILGGVIGVIVGLPVAVLGSVLGGFAGAFLGALAGEWSLHQDSQKAGRAAWGALLGRAAAIAAKIGFGLVIAVWLFADAAMPPQSPAPTTEPADARIMTDDGKS